MSNQSEYKRWAIIAVFVLLVANYGNLMEALGPAIEYDANRAGPVTMYSTSWCGYCKKARRLFERNDIPFEELDIEKSADALQAYQALGGRGVPLIKVGDKVVYGFSYQRIRSLLQCKDCDQP